MELQKFIELFAEQFDETSSDQFTSDTIFKELNEWDSLIALSIISMVDEELEIGITGADIRNSLTIKDLFDLIRLK